MDAIREAILDAFADEHSMSVRRCFYRVSTAGFVPKIDESAGYPTVQRLTVEMRRSGQLPYEWVADATRWMRKPTTYSSIEEALRRTAATFRRSLWDDATVAVEVWCEKEALAGVLVDVTDEWDVPLMVTRGYSSISFLHSAAEAIYERSNRGQRTAIYYFGDHDPSGRDIDRAIVKGIGESLISLDGPDGWPFGDDGPEATFDAFADFERVAIIPQQITAWNLPTRPTKKSDSRAKNFKGPSVELDAIPAPRLRTLVEQVIERHVDQHQLDVLRTFEAEERRGFEQMAAVVNGGGVAELLRALPAGVPAGEATS